MNSIMYAILIIIIIISLMLISYITIFNKLQRFKIKIDEAENTIDEYLRQKYDILSRISNKYKEENKYFKNFESIKNSKISNFDLDRKTTEGINVYKQYMLDKNIVDDLKKEINDNEEHLEAAKSYYNKYTSELNKIIKTFPKNIVAKIHGMKVRNYFDGKNLNDDDLNDFKL